MALLLQLLCPTQVRRPEFPRKGQKTKQKKPFLFYIYIKVCLCVCGGGGGGGVNVLLLAKSLHICLKCVILCQNLTVAPSSGLGVSLTRVTVLSSSSWYASSGQTTTI